MKSVLKNYSLKCFDIIHSCSIFTMVRIKYIQHTENVRTLQNPVV